jgi:phenylacetate-CoA ligase
MSMTGDRIYRPSASQRGWTWVLRNVLLPAGDRFFRQGVMRRLRLLEEAQWWPTERLHEHRDRALSKLAGMIYEQVPFYRELMDETGVGPSDIRRPEDLHRLPVVTKDMLRAAYPDRVSRRTGFRTYEMRTSGSTGSNFSVLHDSELAGWYRATFILCLEWAGWRIGEPHLQTGMTLRRSLDRRFKDTLMRCHYVSACDLRDDALDANLQALERHSIEHLWGYPGSLYYLARRAQQKGWNRPLRSIITWGDNLQPVYRQTLEQTFGTRVTDTYGCGEGMHIAAQCPHGTYHVHTLDVICEFTDEGGRPVADDAPGDIVLTRLHPGPMPFVRYRLGDVGVRGRHGGCTCGRGYDTMQSIEGRRTDVIVTPSGNRLIVHFFTGILEYFSEIEHFQVVQTDADTMVVKIVPTEQFSADSPQRIIEALREKGADIGIQVEPVKDIPVPASGKRRFVINLVDEETPSSLRASASAEPTR